MPVFVISDLILREMRRAAAPCRSAARRLEALPGPAGGGSDDTAGVDGYILGVALEAAPVVSF
jgi:hypothetical protein